MILYGLTLSPLAATVRTEAPVGALSTDYADDDFIVARASDVHPIMTILMDKGPSRGFFVEPEKSFCICHDKSALSLVQQQLAAYKFIYVAGHTLLGGWVGDLSAREAWLKPKIERFVAAIGSLTKIGHRYPQSTFTAMTKSVQFEWQFLLRVLADSKASFAPVENALNDQFIPAILDEAGPISSDLRARFALPVKMSGFGLPNPVENGDHWYATSVRTTCSLTESLLARTDLDVRDYQSLASESRKAATDHRNKRDQAAFDQLRAATPEQARAQLDRSKETGAWLTTFPRSYNGTELSRVEFFDNMRIRANKLPNNLPSNCDGCGECFSPDHAMQCKKGGLITLRHNDQRATHHHLCAQAHKPTEVFDEPLIHTCRDSQGNVMPRTQDDEDLRNTRGDFGVHNFWSPGRTTIFDIRITDLNAKYQRGKCPKKCLARQEMEKKKKYRAACDANRRDFTPLVYSVDGLSGPETARFGRHLAKKLAEKWKRPYSQVCGYVRSRISVSLARSTSLLLRGARQKYASPTQPAWEDGAGLTLFQS